MKALKRKNMQSLISGLLVVALFFTGGCASFSDKDSKPKITPEAKIKRKVDSDEALEARVAAGLKNLQVGDNKRALMHFNKARQWDEKSALLHNAFAMLYRAEGDTEKEEEHYLLAIKYDKKDPKIRHNYGSFLCVNDRYDEGIEQLQLSAGDYQYNNRDQSFENLGLCAKLKGDYDFAEKSFLKAYRINKNRPVSILNLAIIEHRKGDNQKSYELLKKYMESNKHTPESLWLGIQLERIFGNKDAVSSYALVLKKFFPGSKEYKLYQNSLSQLGN